MRSGYCHAKRTCNTGKHELSDWPKILIEIDGKLFKHYDLTTYQRVLYYHLVVKTFAQDRSEVTLTIPDIANAVGASEFTARKAIRELSAIGVVDAEQTRRGYKIAPKLPGKLDLPAADNNLAEAEVDIELIDFFVGRKFLAPLMERENHKCFYCLSEISEENCELDHVVSQLGRGDNTYRNIVAACHRCNTRKQATDAADFVRSLFRKGLLSEEEVTDRMRALEQLRCGELAPNIRHIPI